MQRTKSVLIKILTVICALCCVLALAFGLTACGSDDSLTIVGAHIDENGHLILEMSDDSTIDAGYAQGAKGDKGDKGDAGDKGEAGKDGAAGEKGEAGKDGAAAKNVVGIEPTADGKVVLVYDDGTKSEPFDWDLGNGEASYYGKCSDGGEHDLTNFIVLKGYETANCYHGAEAVAVCAKECGWAQIVETTPKRDHQLKETTVAPTCLTEGYTGVNCQYDDCNYVVDKTNVVPASGHKFGDSYTVLSDGLCICEDGGQMVGMCVNCEKVVSVEVSGQQAHKYTEGEVTVNAPTTVAAGSLSGVCDTCGHQHDVTLPALTVNNWDNKTPALGVSLTVDNPTRTICTEDITITYVAEVYGVEFKFTVEDKADGHYFGGMKMNSVANANGEGAIEYVRKTGSEVTAVNIAYINEYAGVKFSKDSQKVVEFPDDLSNCANDVTGRGYYDCSLCGERVYLDTFKTHKYDESKVTVVEPKCVEDGSKTFECLGCGETVEEKIDKLGHSYEYKFEETTEAGASPRTFKLTGTCGRCGDQTTENLSESQVKIKVTKEATCAAEGTGTVTYTPAGSKTLTITYSIPKINDHTLNGGLMSALVKDVEDKANAAKEDGSWSNGYVEARRKDGKVTIYYLVTTESTKPSVDPSNVHGFYDNPATCKDEGGRGWFQCKVCGDDVYVTTTADHRRPDNLENATATCVKNGEVTYNCPECTIEITETAEAIGHKWSATPEVELLEEGGYAKLTYTCANCKETLEITVPVISEAVKGTSGTYYYEETSKATCSKAGMNTYYYNWTKAQSELDEEADYNGTYKGSYSFTVTTEATGDHNSDGIAATWATTAEDGTITAVFVGHLCADCGNMVVDARYDAVAAGSAEAGNYTETDSTLEWYVVVEENGKQVTYVYGGFLTKDGGHIIVYPPQRFEV